MSFQAAKINDALKRIEAKLDRLLGEPDTSKTAIEVQAERLTENQIKMAKVRAARKVNTGQGGRG